MNFTAAVEINPIEFIAKTAIKTNPELIFIFFPCFISHGICKLPGVYRDKRFIVSILSEKKLIMIRTLIGELIIVKKQSVHAE